MGTANNIKKKKQTKYNIKDSQKIIREKKQKRKGRKKT